MRYLGTMSNRTGPCQDPNGLPQPPAETPCYPRDAGATTRTEAGAGAGAEAEAGAEAGAAPAKASDAAGRRISTSDMRTILCIQLTPSPLDRCKSII